MKAHQAMKTMVIAAKADTTVDDTARILTTHHIRSVPVVDGKKRVIGIISEDDLFLKERGIPFSAVRLPALFRKWVDPQQLTDIYEGA